MAEQTRRAIVLFQPRDTCRAMPLGLLHVGSALGGMRVEVVDGRLELAPESRVVELIRDAACLGVSVASGPPVAEALRVSAAARAVRPDLFVVWGGAHATYRPDQCLVPGAADACVIGPGEEALRRIAEAVVEGVAPGAIAGVARREGEGVSAAAPDPEGHIRETPPADYSLLDLDRHFRLRGTRGIDYCSSRHASGPKWQGLPSDRVVAEVTGLVRRFRLSEVRMADEDFFGDPDRALAVARGLVVSGLRMRWYARSAGNGLLGLGGGEWDLLRASGLGRVHVPVSQGAPIAPEDALEMAKALRSAGIGGAFAFVVGRFGEDPQWAARVLDVSRAIREVHRGFETEVRFWAPWPTDELLSIPGFTEPSDLAAWAGSSLGRVPATWVSERTLLAIERRVFFQRRAFETPGKGAAKWLVHWAARARLKAGFYRMDLERRIVGLSERLRGDVRELELRADE